MLKASDQPKKVKTGKGLLSALARDLRGNTSIMTAMAMVPLLGLVGGGVDAARGYAVKSRLQHACDSGALAVRRVMSGSTPTSGNIAEGNKFFDFNFEDQTFGIPRSKITRSFTAGSTAGSINGAASAEMDVSLMRIFGTNDINISVSCEATISVPNTDIMFVLDVTGSMAATPSGDSISKLAGLKLATKDFFDELGQGSPDGVAGRIRYGFVPYSSNVNVGRILKNLDKMFGHLSELDCLGA